MLPCVIRIGKVSPKQEFGEKPAHGTSFAALAEETISAGLLPAAAGRGWGAGEGETENRRKCRAANTHPNRKQLEDARIRKWDPLLFHKLS